MENLAKQLTLKYTLLQCTYWISQCAIYSFAAVFLQSRNFNNTQIGIVLALAAILSILLQPLVASFADKTTKVSLRQIVIVLMAAVYILALLLYIAPDSFWLVAVLYILINACSFTLNPLFNSLALEYMNLGVPMNYGLSRGLGSVAFAVMSFILGRVVTQFGAGILLTIFLVTYCFAIASAIFFQVKLPQNMLSADLNPGSLNSLTQSDSEDDTKTPSGILTFFVKYKMFMFFLCGVAMIFYSHSLINTYLINIMENAGGGSTDMGISLSIAATLELPAMAGFIFILKKFKCSRLVVVSAFFFLVKVFITWLAPSVWMIHLSQTCQLISYALFTPASVYYVNSIMDKHDRVKGQAMLGVATIGIAGSVANITGGKILDTLGVSDMLLLGTWVTAAGVIIIAFTAKEPRQNAAA